MNPDIVKTTCPRDCYDTCGIEVRVEDEQIVSVRGDKEHFVSRGKLCQKCQLFYNGILLDKEARLRQPLKRIGEKGEGLFESVSWDEAMEAISQRLKHILSTNDASNILHAHYTGTCSLIAGHFPMRFFNRLGAREVEPDTVCNMAGHVALKYMLGTSLHGFDPRTVVDSKCILVWGGNPSASAPHAHTQWLPEAACPVIVVDPIRHATAEEADMHLQLFPGTDAALAFSMMHVLKNEDLIDPAFIDAYTIGWDEIAPEIDNCTLEWGSEQTGIPESQIIDAARIYGAGPALMWLGQGLQRQPTGGNIIRCCASMAAICGNFSKPGAGLLYLNGSGQKGVDIDYIRGSNLAKETPDSISQMDMADFLEEKDNTKAFICWNINPVASSPDQTKLIKALERDDLFTVVLDIFPTDTSDYADYVLPASSFLEFDDLVSGYFNLSFSAQTKAAEIIKGAMPNQDIFRLLSKAMGFSEEQLYESDEEIIATVLNDVGIQGGFDRLKKKGTVFPNCETQIQFDNFNFPTTSGKIEIASKAAEEDGHPRLPQPHTDKRPSNSFLRLLTPASFWLMNSSYGNDPKVLRQLGASYVIMHPKDAKKRCLNELDTVRLSNKTGTLVLTLKVSDIVPEGVLMSPKGRWLRTDTKNKVNVNVLNPGIKSDMGESSSVHGVEVLVSPVT